MRIAAASSRGSTRAIRSCGGRRIRARCCGPSRRARVAFAAQAAAQGGVPGHHRSRVRARARRLRRAARRRRRHVAERRDATRLHGAARRRVSRIRSRCGWTASWPAASTASAIGRMFFGESMFSRRTDASKIAMARLAAQLDRWGFPLIDCQLETDHLVSLGAEHDAAAAVCGRGRAAGRSSRRRHGRSTPTWPATGACAAHAQPGGLSRSFKAL